MRSCNGINKITDSFKKVVGYHALCYIAKYTPVVGQVVQEKFNKEVRKKPRFLTFVPDIFKTQEMCDKTIKDDPSSLRFVPDWFVSQEQLKLWHDSDDWLIRWWYNNRLIKRYDGYKKRKAQKAKIKEELLLIAWHPSRWWDWCMSEDEKQETEKLWK